MTRQIDTENNIEIVDETTNNSFPVPPVTGNITGAGFAKTVNLAITEIDGKLGAVTTDLSTEISNAITPVSNKADQNESDITDLDNRLTTAEGDITTNTSGISTLNSDVTALQNLNLVVVDSLQTSNFTATANRVYLIDTTNNVVELTLPDDPEVGNIVGFKDATKQFSTNLLRVIPGQSGSPSPVQDNIEGQSGAAATFEIQVDGIFLLLQYTSTRGWIFR